MFYKAKVSFQESCSSLLGLDSQLQGEILFNDILRLDGNMEGKIISKSAKNSTLFIGKNSEVKADVVADNVIIAGNFIGKIFATQKIEIKKNARFEGMAFTVDLIVQKNAFFHGRSFMMQHLNLIEKSDIKLKFQKKNFTITPNLMESFHYLENSKLK